MNERDIFLQARLIADAQERDRFLKLSCGGDDSRKKRIASLLEFGSDDSFLKLEDTVSTVPSKLETVGDRIGPYKLIEPIGEGGFGIVFRAEQIEPVRRHVALKLIKPGMDSKQVIARFEAERQALAIMDHPNIATVFDAGTTSSGRPFFVMELVRGIPITRFCDQTQATLTQRLELFSQVCQAIQHAHAKGIIHRDIKPGNVLVAMYDDRPVPKVIDFGVAKATGYQLTEKSLHTGFGSIVGSLEYMSPEQASFNQLDIDTRSDVYSLGVLLYELIAGSPPVSLEEIQRAGVLESLKMIRESEPVRPSLRLSTQEGIARLAANRGMPPAKLMTATRGDLDWIVMKAIEKKRERRYETVQCLGEEIYRFLRGEPVQAHPPQAAYLVQKWLQRNGRIAMTVAIVTTFIAMSAWFFWRESANRAHAMHSHSNRVQIALNRASESLSAARAASIGSQTEWVAARESTLHLRALLEAGIVEPRTYASVTAFLADFDQAANNRTIAERIEEVVMLSATHPDLEHWEKMEADFRQLFLEQGIDPTKMSSTEVAERLRNHPSSVQLCDAFELWIGTLGQMSALGGPRATAETMQPFADALLAADSDPVRTGIRRLIYSGRLPTRDEAEGVIRDQSLHSLSPRTLSWLASLFYMAQAPDRGREIFDWAADRFPDDFMLNFDYAYLLESSRDWTGAIRYYLRSTALRPRVAGIWRALGNAYFANGEHIAARRAHEKALELAPADSGVHLDLAKSVLEQKEFKLAEEFARSSIRLGKPSPASLLLLGKSLAGQQKYSESLTTLEECKRMAPDSFLKEFEVDKLIETTRAAIGGSAR